MNETEYFRTGIRIKKETWNQLSLAGIALGIKKGKLFETIIAEWLERNNEVISNNLKQKSIGNSLENVND